MACANISDDVIGFTSDDYLKVIKIVGFHKSGVRTDYLLRFESHPSVPDEWFTYPIKGCLSGGVFNLETILNNFYNFAQYFIN